jgi:hypothetical protein
MDEQLIKDKTINIIYNTYERSLAEFLPYYYLSKIDNISKYVIVHDSTYFKQYYDFSNINDKFLFHFRNHSWDELVLETDLLKCFNHKNDIFTLYMNNYKWCGMFGGMSVVNSDFIKFIYNKYNFDCLLDKLDSRKKRMCFERIIAIFFFLENKVSINDCSIFGDYYGESFNEPRNEQYLVKLAISR